MKHHSADANIWTHLWAFTQHIFQRWWLRQPSHHLNRSVASKHQCVTSASLRQSFYEFKTLPESTAWIIGNNFDEISKLRSWNDIKCFEMLKEQIHGKSHQTILHTSWVAIPYLPWLPRVGTSSLSISSVWIDSSLSPTRTIDPGATWQIRMTVVDATNKIGVK